MIVWDKETNNLLDKVTEIHCIVVIDRDTNVVECYFDKYNESKTTIKPNGSIIDGLKRVREADEIGGHNVSGYDIPVGQKLYPGQFIIPRSTKVRDSLVESEMWYPGKDLRNKDFLAHKRKGGKWIPKYLMGKHSLEAWGARLGAPKDDYSKRCKDAGIDPWAEFNHDMLEYCIIDVQTNIKLFDFLESHFDYVGAAEAVAIENRVAPILVRQKQWGVTFNVQKAGELHATLVARHGDIAAELRDKYFQPFMTKNGKTVVPKKTMKRKNPGGWIDHITEGAPYIKIKQVEFNPGSRTHIFKRLIAEYNWKPTVFSNNGDPMVDEEVLETLMLPPVKLLMEYLTLDKRLGQLVEGQQAWLRQERDGIIHHRVHQNGTRTTRCAHSGPNLGQVPKVGKPYGKQCRALFGPRKRRQQLGVDLSGIEMRAQGHYLQRFDGGKFAMEVVSGDVHELARIAMAFNSRDITKTFEYAMTYGSGYPNLGTIVYSDMTDKQKAKFGTAGPRKFARLGKERKTMLAQGLTGFDKLLDAVEKAFDRKFLKTLLGLKISVPSKHSALNTLYQGFGGTLAKVWLVTVNDALVDAGLIPDGRWYIHPDEVDAGLWKAVQMLFVHDELQFDCDPEVTKQVGELSVKAAQSMREVLKLHVAIDATYKVGSDWAECH